MNCFEWARLNAKLYIDRIELKLAHTPGNAVSTQFIIDLNDKILDAKMLMACLIAEHFAKNQNVRISTTIEQRYSCKSTSTTAADEDASFFINVTSEQKEQTSKN
ncbi:hypothetical protein V5F53_02700 [Xanthobacter sp. V4C-4]|uniref:hypothetical protein n=1 Tax=Xanthobacter cornucopiae TaxID=3119924 RepID=UPI003726C796